MGRNKKKWPLKALHHSCSPPNWKPQEFQQRNGRWAPNRSAPPSAASDATGGFDSLGGSPSKMPPMRIIHFFPSWFREPWDARGDGRGARSRRHPLEHGADPAAHPRAPALSSPARGPRGAPVAMKAFPRMCDSEKSWMEDGTYTEAEKGQMWCPARFMSRKQQESISILQWK